LATKVKLHFLDWYNLETLANVTSLIDSGKCKQSSRRRGQVSVGLAFEVDFAYGNTAHLCGDNKKFEEEW
jgi:hypothetical protein